MPRMQMGLSSYERAEGDLPGLPVVNMYVEQAPTEDSGVALQSRKGLTDRAADMGAGPVQQLFKRDLVEGSTLYGVSGGYFYDGTTQVGAIAGSGFVSMAGNEIGIMTTAGGTLYFFASDVLNTVAFPDSADVAHVTVGGARYWLVRKDTGKLYFTDALESDVEALDFLTAESLPDRLLQTLWVDGGLIAFGAESVEFFQQTGNAELPITPLINLVFEKGLRATGCATNFGPTFAWVTNENQVCVQTEDNIISNPGLEARIAASATCRLFTFILSGDEFLALRLDSETQVFNRRSGAWSEFASYGRANWIPQCFAGGVFGSGADGRTLAWDSSYSDFGSTHERRFRAGFSLNSGGVTIQNVQLRLNPGQTADLTGTYANPIIEMRQSRDAGQTWGDWKQVALGEQGQYRKKVQWRALGMASQPGFLAEFRVTDPVSLRVSEALVNEPYGGR